MNETYFKECGNGEKEILGAGDDLFFATFQLRYCCGKISTKSGFIRDWDHISTLIVRRGKRLLFQIWMLPISMEQEALEIGSLG
jgi:hypothetical protein